MGADFWTDFELYRPAIEEALLNGNSRQLTQLVNELAEQLAQLTLA